jgi:dienelactone hydrolase
MTPLSLVTRRRMMHWGLASASAPVFARALGVSAQAQDLGPGAGRLGIVGGRDEKVLFPGKGLPGGGQLEIRLVQSMYTSDADELEVAQRARPYDPDSWHTEWARVAEKNEKLADQFAAQGFKVTANEHYRRAQDFYGNAAWPLPESDRRMLPSYRKMREMFDKAGQMVRPPFERVKIAFDGKTLEGYFRKPGGAAARNFPTVIAFQGADTMAENTILGGAGSYVARGMAYLAVDFPGQGGALRLQDLHLPPDTERILKALIDYLETRTDVDATGIGVQGISMGGWGGPRAASGEKRIKAVWVGAGSYDLGADLFDYYPPIQDRVRWIIGARDLTDARKKLRDYTLDGRANKIECAMLIGYGGDDRIMDPNGAHRLYQAAVNAKREMLAGLGHPQHNVRAGGPRGERATLQDWAMKQLRADAEPS